MSELLDTFIILKYLDFALRAVLAVHVILSRRPVPVALAWLSLLLVPIPYLGVLLYLVVGEPRLGARRTKRYADLTQGFLERAVMFWKATPTEWDPECRPYCHIATVASVVGEIPPLRGNTVRFLSGSEATIAALIKDIDEAQKTVHLLFYIWQERGAGEMVTAALERAASRGVTCRVLVDAVGSKKFLRSELPVRLKKAGAELSIALPVNFIRMFLSRVDLRNHRKIAVIDGKIGYAGSQNITDNTFKFKPLRKIGPWIDSMVRVKGPAAQALDVVFLRDWYSESGQDLSAVIDELLPQSVRILKEGCTVHVVPSGPGSGIAPMREAMLAVIFSARRELIITTPYFVPDDATKSALTAAAFSGVEVTLVMPKHPDALITSAAGRAEYHDLLQAGVKIKHFRKGLLHSKTITVDSNVAVIGSANLDMRSFWLNFEITLFVYDPDEASLLRMLQVSYMEASEDVFLDEWIKRPWWRKLGQKAARLLGPLL